MYYPNLRPDSGHLCPIFNCKILELSLLVLWFCAIRSTKSNLIPNPISGKTLFSRP